MHGPRDPRAVARTRLISGYPFGLTTSAAGRACLAKKAKHKVKAAKGKTKKDAGKVKHKGRKAKNAAKH